MEIYKVLGTENPADLMTKILTVSEIEERLRGMNIEMYNKYTRDKVESHGGEDVCGLQIAESVIGRFLDEQR